MAMCMYEHVEVEEWKFDPPFFPSTVYLERRPRIPATADLDTNRKFMLAFPAFAHHRLHNGERRLDFRFEA
jgi:hypothetical protein